MKIVVVGVGGGGCQAVHRMLRAGLCGVDFAAVDIDLAALNHSDAAVRLALGEHFTGGRSTGGNPRIGERAAEANADALFDLCDEADLVLIVAGLGGGTGTGAAPVVAEIAQSYGALTVGVVTTPTPFEDAQRQKAAQQGLTKLQEMADTAVVVPAEQASQRAEQPDSLETAFGPVHDLVGEAVRSIVQPLTQPVFVRVELTDIRSVLQGGRRAIFGRGEGIGFERAARAAQAAIRSPSSGPAMQESHFALATIRGGPDLAAHEFHTVFDLMCSALAPHASLRAGTVADPALQDTVRVGIVALVEPPLRSLTGPYTTFLRNPRRPDAPGDEPPTPSGVPRRPRPGSLFGAAAVEPPRPDRDDAPEAAAS